MLENAGKMQTWITPNTDTLYIVLPQCLTKCLTKQIFYLLWWNVGTSFHTSSKIFQVTDPVDSGGKLNVLYTFSLRPVSTGEAASSGFPEKNLCLIFGKIKKSCIFCESLSAKDKPKTYSKLKSRMLRCNFNFKFWRKKKVCPYNVKVMYTKT